MAVQFIVGRSGSGKTTYCLNSMIEMLRQAPTGQSLIFLVPEQATFQMEQALLTAPDVVGYHRAHVMSFERLARKVLWETSPPDLPVLSEFSRQMILRRLLQEHRDELHVFSRVLSRSGFVAQLSQLIRELRQYQHTVDDLIVRRETLIELDNPADKGLVEKLGDLAVIYKAWQETLSGRFIDQDDYLDMVSTRCREADFLKDAYLWADGFAGFTPQQYSVLIEMIRCSKQAQLTMCVDPLSEQFKLAEQNLNSTEQLDETDLFYPLLKTYQQMVRKFQGEGLTVGSPVILPKGLTQPATMPRFAGCETLAGLEREFLLSPKEEVLSKETDTIPTTGHVVVETLHRRAEVEAVAKHIMTLTREQGYRYRDIAIILRDFSHYQDLLETTFKDYKLPYFIDQRRAVHHHPFVELLRSVLQVVISDFKTEYVIDYLKTDLLPLSREVVDRLENYALAMGVRARRWADAENWSDDKTDLDEYRREAMKPLIAMREALGGEVDKTFTVKQLAGEVVRVCGTLNIGSTMADWYQAAQEAGQLDQAQLHEQLYSDVMDCFDDLVDTLGDVDVTLSEFSEILCTALEQLRLKLVPPALDQILIGTIERSRHPKIRAGFVLGFNEQIFPKVAKPDAFFSDKQRQTLTEQGFELDQPSSEKLLAERYLAYIALTRAHEFLWVSYPLADEKGVALQPSMLVESIFEAVETPFVRLAEDEGQPQFDDIMTTSQLAEKLSLAFSVVRQEDAIDPAWQVLYQSVLNEQVGVDEVRKGLAGVVYDNAARLDAAVVDELYSETIVSSITQLETFAACPFKYFARYVLKLEEREELKLGVLDLGNFYHDVLYHLFKLLQSKGLTWRELDDEQIDAMVDEVVGKLVSPGGRYASLYAQSSRNRFQLAEGKRSLGLLCRALRSGAKVGHFDQQYAELEFKAGGDVGPLRVELDGGRVLELRGKIDRVDVATREVEGSTATGVAVFDYKSSVRAFQYDQFYHGLSLQLVSYLLVMQDYYAGGHLGNVEVVGAFYCPIRVDSASMSEMASEEVLSNPLDSREVTIKVRGVMNGDWVSAFDYVSDGWSSYYDIRLTKKDGVYGSTSAGAVRPGEMEAVLAYGRETLVALASDVTAGVIDVSPYRLGEKSTPCGYCDYRSVCRFDFNADSYRFLPKYKKGEVLELISKV